MKMGIRSVVVVGSVVGVFTLAGCSADSIGEDVEALASIDESNGLHASNETVSLNCAPAFPGLPAPPCNPDLRFLQTFVQVVPPGGNIAPGRYVYFQFINDSKKAAGAFTARIKDHTGAVLKTFAYPNGLAAGASSTLVIHAPYTCGWSRMAELDFGNTVLEASDGNNTNSYSFYCPRGG